MSKPERSHVPLDPPLARELVDFWTYIWGEPPDVPNEVYLGSEAEHNDTTVFFERSGDQFIGTCTLTVPKAMPVVADLGAVATHPDFRNRGVSTRVCGQAVQEFFDGGGQALFVGTGSPAAIRVYERLGCRKLPGADWWIRVADGEPPEAFLVDYFRRPAGSVTVGSGSPADRVPMIPLMASPHRWRVLDANARILSTAYVSAGSFTHYLRYTQTVSELGGTWFTAKTYDGRAVGVASARPTPTGPWRVDGFTQSWYFDAWPELIGAAVNAAAESGAATCYVDVAFGDDEKLALLEAIGFRQAGPGDTFDLAGTEVTSTRLERRTEC